LASVIRIITLHVQTLPLADTHACSQLQLSFTALSNVNGFLRQDRPNQLKCICKLGNRFLASIAACNKTLAFPLSM